MRGYKQMSLDEREQLYRLHADGITARAMARRLKRSHSTVIRELQRNSDVKLGYLPDRAHHSTAKRRFHRIRKMEADYRLRELVLSRLREGWSPEQIAGRMKLEKCPIYICKEAIYQYIYDVNILKQKLYCLLPKRKKKRTSRFKRKSRGGIPGAVPINKRPNYINNRKKFGHWEGDLVLFGVQRCGNITTLLERKTRYAVMIYNGYKYTDTVMGNIKQTIAQMPENTVKSITFDRGTEFAAHASVPVRSFFCDPGSPWQKGSNENFNGRLRRYLPKTTYTSQINQQILEELMQKMNNTPRKILGFKTPKEAFDKQLYKSGAL